MSINLRLPNITETTPEGQLRQMHSFLYQTIEQLNWALNTLESGGSGAVVMQGKNTAGSSSGGEDKKDSGINFNELKAMIIKSADIVNAYYETIEKKLSGKYVAVSDFGTYTEETDRKTTENADGIKDLYSNIQSIVSKVDGVQNTLIEVNACIKSGLLYYNEAGVPIFGLEIGQTNEIDGVKVFNQYARFTADRLVFYDYNGQEMAYISDKKLYINDIEVSSIVVSRSLSVGGFVEFVQDDHSVVKRWVGGEGQWQ